MEQSSKKKAHQSCSCDRCTMGRATKAAQLVHKQNEKKLRRMTKLELRKAVMDAQRELEDIDVLGRINSPYTD
jgi:hypothetical protein